MTASAYFVAADDDADLIRAIIRIRDTHRDLTPFGFALPDDTRRVIDFDVAMARRQDHATARVSFTLPEGIAEVRAATDFLRSDAAPKTLRAHRTSYGLKHGVERAVGRYISNGSLIVAALGLGLVVERISGTPNARISFPRPALVAA